ncbi:hypothetical protein DENSPDRAFT_145181 [Dentipellis sp. KUC8613]|nr:hypothetical protein DENSPDRAFT_145181 [Dentipellis sp. KUC8613]
MSHCARLSPHTICAPATACRLHVHACRLRLRPPPRAVVHSLAPTTLTRSHLVSHLPALFSPRPFSFHTRAPLSCVPHATCPHPLARCLQPRTTPFVLALSCPCAGAL